MNIDWMLVLNIVKWLYIFSAMLYWVVDIYVMTNTIRIVNTLNHENDVPYRARISVQQIVRTIVDGLIPFVNIITAVAILRRLDDTIETLIDRLINESDTLYTNENCSCSLNNCDNHIIETPKNSNNQFGTYRKYRKKPVIINAIQYTGDNISDLANFAGNKITIKHETADKCTVFVHTLEGTLEINRNDYLIKGIQDDFYPCKPDIFWQTYEEVID